MCGHLRQHVIGQRAERNNDDELCGGGGNTHTPAVDSDSIGFPLCSDRDVDGDGDGADVFALLLGHSARYVVAIEIIDIRMPLALDSGIPLVPSFSDGDVSTRYVALVVALSLLQRRLHQ